MSRDLRVAIVGGGMAGILAAVKLREAGIDDFVLYEKAERLGGTWRDNTYPGVACDVPSHLYSYSFAPNPDFSRQFAPGAEIEAYFEAVARSHGVYDHARFGEEVTHCVHGANGWEIETATGTRDRADVVLLATGVLHHPRHPQLEGVELFSGAAFHSARWDHAVPLDGRRVGVIGTGSTAVQIVSALVPRVAELMLFQRSAQWILPQDNPEYVASDRAAFREQPELVRHIREKQAQMFTEGFSNAVIDADSAQMRQIEEVCRKHLEESVTDLVLRERLRPSYRAACKRLVISGDFYRAIQQPNAKLVTSPIAGVERSGVRTRDGALHALDVLVFATGFRADRFMRPMHVLGRGGVSLDALWAERPEAYLTVAIPGLPNLFMLNGPSSPIGNFSLIEAAEVQLAYIMQLLEQLRAGRFRELSPSAEACAGFNAERCEAARGTIWSTGCTSWYLDDRGIPTAWPWSFQHFRERLRAPDLEAFERR